MRWPADHPALADPALAVWSAGADELCPDADVVRILRHLPGRRVASLVRLRGGEAILKVYSSPRARGNYRRLRAFERSGVGDLLPRPYGADLKGHVLLLEFVIGMPLDTLDPVLLNPAARAAGETLRRIHECGAALDREWTVDREIEQLRRTAGPQTRLRVEEAIRLFRPGAGGGLVPSHRDCYPAQAVLGEEGIRWIDLDDAAMAPSGLDVGNFLAHMTREVVVGRWLPATLSESRRAFLAGYAEEPPDLERWERLSLARLAALAETRHRSEGEMRRLLARLAA